MTTCGVVLAAGAGRRFGGPKQLAELNGRPLVQWALDAACAAPALARVVLVLGAQADVIEPRLDLVRAEVVRCPDWSEGIAASLRCGFDAAAGADWVVLILGDEPRLPAEAIERVVGVAHAAPDEVLAARATWAGRPGHPVALSRRLADRVEALRGDRGARDLLVGAAAVEVDCSDLGDPDDVDTPEQMQELHL